VRAVRTAAKAELPGAIALCPPSALKDVWTRRFAEPVTAFASGWMRVRARARQRGVELPLVISDHADWDGLIATIPATGASEIWVTHGAEDALVHWCRTQGLAATPLNIVGYGEEDEASGEGGAPPETGAGPSPPSFLLEAARKGGTESGGGGQGESQEGSQGGSQEGSQGGSQTGSRA
jgi:putative mRNA 3-end processing factor